MKRLIQQLQIVINDNWNHLYNYVLIEYITNSIYLILGISFLTLIIGTGTAWVVTNYNFYGKNILESILILPLAIPPYILAYTFTGLFDLNGTINIILRNIFIFDSNFILFDNIRNIYGAIIVFSFDGHQEPRRIRPAGQRAKRELVGRVRGQGCPTRFGYEGCVAKRRNGQRVHG